MATLLDGNVLVALVVEEHTHHPAATRWFLALDGPFATTPITQGTLLRALIRGGLDASDAVTALDALGEDPRHRFWPDDRGYDGPTLHGVIGHRQITDAYLAAQARARGGSLATFDRGLAALHRDVAHLIDV